MKIQPPSFIRLAAEAARVLERLWQDLRYAFRGLRRSPGFAAVAILSLALGIGANTAIFSLIDLLLLRPLPVKAPGQLVEVLNQYPGDPFLNAFSIQSFEYFRDHNRAFSAITAEQPAHVRVRNGAAAIEVVDGERVAGNFFQLLGVTPAIGRFIQPEDDRVGDPHSAVAVASWSYWKNRFNLDPSVLGARVTVDDVPLTIIGVAPREFFGLQIGFQPDLWMPLSAEWARNPGARFSPGGVRLIARLKPGVTIERSRAEMVALFQWTVDERVTAANSEARRALERRLKFAVEPAGAGLSTALRTRFANPLLALMAIVALLLLLACANTAGILLARGAARQREIALRVSLGASRLRLLRQVLTECLLLSAAGGLLAIFFAYFASDALVATITSGRFVGGPPHIDISVLPERRVLLFTAAIAALTAVLCGLAPAWRALVSPPATALRAMPSSGATRFSRILGKTLVVAQVALSLGVLSGAALFIRHLANLEHADLGFNRDRVLLLTIDPSRTSFGAGQLPVVYQEILARMERIPGVVSAALSGPGPLSGAGASRFVSVEGYRERPEERRYISINWVGPKYFATLGIPLLAGHDFSAADRDGSPIAIINQAMARYYFAERNPIGKHLTFDRDQRSYEIIGVAGDAKYTDIREAAPRTIYLSAFSLERPPSTFTLRTAGNPLTIAPAARRIALELMKDAPIPRVTTLEEQVDATIVPERLIASLSGAFGVLGSLLAALGIYGLLAYTVSRRINEIGVRMALGANRAAVFRLVLREALTLACAGIAIGAPIAWWGERLAAGLVKDLPLQDALPLALSAIAMVAIALVAAWLPARRAAGIDPIEALRHE